MYDSKDRVQATDPAPADPGCLIANLGEDAERSRVAIGIEIRIDGGGQTCKSQDQQHSRCARSTFPLPGPYAR